MRSGRRYQAEHAGCVYAGWGRHGADLILDLISLSQHLADHAASKEAPQQKSPSNRDPSNETSGKENSNFAVSSSAQRRFQRDMIVIEDGEGEHVPHTYWLLLTKPPSPPSR